MMTDLPGAPDTKEVSTYSNAAYDAIKYSTETGERAGQEGTGGGVTVDEEAHYAVICPTPSSRPPSANPPAPQEYESPVTQPPPTGTGYVNVSDGARASETERVEEAVYAHISEEK